MDFTRESATERAVSDLAERLNVDSEAIERISVTEKDFPDMSLGAPVDGEMSAQMISSGWEINLGVNDESYQYRADKYQVRLVDYQGENHIVEEH